MPEARLRVRFLESGVGFRASGDGYRLSRREGRLAQSPYLPLPALGRRPWFAFLRRARIRRRFALAMAAEGNSGAGRYQQAVRLRAGSWESAPLLLATSRHQRRIGLRPAPGACGMLLRGRSVHGFGMRIPLDVVALDGAGRVVRSVVLRPRRIVWVRGASWIAEMAVSGRDLPPPGTQVVADRLGTCPAR